jgi:cytochrome b561
LREQASSVRGEASPAGPSHEIGPWDGLSAVNERLDGRTTPAAMRMADSRNGYGWISIAFHWLTAAIVLTMLIIGSMSQGADEEASLRLVHLHTTIGVTAYAFLWGRIIWRFTVGHPGPLPKQGAFFFAIGKYFHFLLLVAIAAMLVSGPAMIWLDGAPIHVFSLAISSPLGKLPGAQHLLRVLHGYAGSFILVGMILHVFAVFKHTVFNRDGTFDKIMIAAGGRSDRLDPVSQDKAKA